MKDVTISKMASVTPADGSNLPVDSYGLYVGVSGDVKVTTVDGYEETMVGLAAGVWHPIQARRVWSTGTTATDILIGW